MDMCLLDIQCRLHLDNNFFLSLLSFLQFLYRKTQQHDDIDNLEIEIEGAKKVLSKCQGDDVISIFLVPPSLEELERRIRGRRTESEEIVQERLAKAAREMKLQDRYKHVVFNDDLETASLEIAKIIRNYM